MNTHWAPASRIDPSDGLASAERPDSQDAAHETGWTVRLAPCVAFFVMVFASMAAAATVITEAPLILVGLY